jgi:hypothetical protein
MDAGSLEVVRILYPSDRMDVLYVQVGLMRILRASCL